MALKLDVASAKIDVDTKGIVSAVNVFAGAANPFALCHLTRGANLSGSGFNFAPAIKVTGTVDILRDTGDDQNGWDFNFLQFGNLMVRSALWGGRTPAEGSVSINYAVPPAFATNPSLDTTADRSPFVGINFSNQDIVADGPPARITLTRVMGDHPNSKQILKVPNLTTKVSNLLFNMRLDAGFTTVFVARDPSKVFTFLAHFNWHLIYDARFQWQGDTCTGTMADGRFDVGPVTPGKPADATLQTLLANPKGPFYNDLSLKATNAVATTPTAPNFVESATRDPSIPASFVN